MSDPILEIIANLDLDALKVHPFEDYTKEHLVLALDLNKLDIAHYIAAHSDSDDMSEFIVQRDDPALYLSWISDSAFGRLC